LDVGEASADDLDHLPVPARLDLNLDALVAVGHLALDFFQKLFVRVLYPDGDAARNLRTHAAEVLPEWHAQTRRLQVPEGGLNRRLRHAVAAHALQQVADPGGRLDFPPERHRREEAFGHFPRAVNPLLAVEGAFARGALAPALGPLAVFDAHEQDAPLDGAPETGLEKVHEAQAYLAHLDPNDFHLDKDSGPWKMR
jgi:hypothetical protein